MTTLQKLLIENTQSIENRNTILAIAKDVLSNIVNDNDSVEWAEVDENENTVRFGFTQDGLNTEEAVSLDTDARRQFHEEFALRIKAEHAELL